MFSLIKNLSTLS
uniref:Uncharacterized protein n=1 Tax=Arundo donax TaxID=35708 RepID=A0A0A9AH86_ARUDO